MSRDIQDALHALEHDYYAGVGFDLLSQRIIAICQSIAALGVHAPIRGACEAFAPTLWGATSGSALSVDAVKAALARDNAADYLRAWAHFSRAAAAYQIAA